MHFTWESNPARRISRLTRYLHSTTHSPIQVFSFTRKLITCNLTVCVGKKLVNTTNIFSSVFRAATTLRIARHLFAYIFGIVVKSEEEGRQHRIAFNSLYLFSLGLLSMKRMERIVSLHARRTHHLLSLRRPPSSTCLSGLRAEASGRHGLHDA